MNNLSLPALNQIFENFSNFSNDVFVVQGSRIKSYSQIQDYAKHFSVKIHNHGLNTQDRIIVNLPKNIYQISLILAIWANESIYIPIDSETPAERKEVIKNDSNAKLIIDENLLKCWLSDFSSTNENFCINAKPNDLAYIIYTSGSTGIPKGVCVSFMNLNSKLYEELHVLSLNKRIASFLLTNFAFDVSILELFIPIITGGKIVIPQNESNFSKLVSEIYINKVDILQGTPTFFNTFLGNLSKDEYLSLNTTLKVVCIGGESLTRSLVDKFKTNLPNVQLNNHYGPTETTIDAIVLTDVKKFDKNSLGFPLCRTSILILNDFREELPDGEIGEIAISGDSVARGYWNRTELTKKSFINLKGVHGKVYLTGDLAKKSDDGSIIFYGRKDTQVKFLGYRIELEEISFHLKSIKGVKSGHVELIDSKLVAWVEAKSDISKGFIKERMIEKLPFYMIPTTIVFLDKFPTTANGKVDSKKLIKYYNEKFSFTYPLDDIQKQISVIWKELLQLEEISIKSSFFELGGNSLRLMILRNSIHRVFNVLIPVNFFYYYSSIEEISDVIKTIKWAKKVN